MHQAAGTATATSTERALREPVCNVGMMSVAAAAKEDVHGTWRCRGSLEIEPQWTPVMAATPGRMGTCTHILLHPLPPQIRATVRRTLSRAAGLHAGSYTIRVRKGAHVGGELCETDALSTPVRRTVEGRWDLDVHLHRAEAGHVRPGEALGQAGTHTAMVRTAPRVDRRCWEGLVTKAAARARRCVRRAAGAAAALAAVRPRAGAAVGATRATEEERQAMVQKG
jgi:hypothetical protein